MGIETGALLAYASIASAVIGAGVSYYSATEQAKAVERTAEYNNQVARAKARNLEQEQAEARRRQRIKNRRRMAAMRTRMAGQGTLTTTGTPLAILGESWGNMELQISDAARNASIRANDIRARGSMSLWQGQQEASGIRTAAIGNAVSDMSSAVGSYNAGVYNGSITDSFNLYG